MVRDAGFPVYTVLRPGFFMENFLRPMADYMFPDLRRGQLVTAVAPQTLMHLVAVDDIGQAAAAALNDPVGYDGAAVELAGDLQTMGQIAHALGQAAGVVVDYCARSPDALVDAGHPVRWVKTQDWYNSAPCPARPQIMSAFGLTPTCFADWARRHADRLDVRSGR